MGTEQQLSAAELAGIRWRISTRSSSNGGQCVEAGPLADGSGRIAVRHSRHPDGSLIIYTRAEWDAFLVGAKDGEFDFTNRTGRHRRQPTGPPAFVTPCGPAVLLEALALRQAQHLGSAGEVRQQPSTKISRLSPTPIKPALNRRTLSWLGFDTRDFVFLVHGLLPDPAATPLRTA